MTLLGSQVRQAYNLFDEVTKPKTTHIKDKQELELVHNRNKAFIIIHLLAASQYFMNLLMRNGDMKANVYGAIGTSTISLILLLTIHLGVNPQIFNTIYNIYALLFGLLQKKHDEHGIFGAWLAAPVFPVFIYFMTGSIKHFAAHAICQSILMNVFYQDLIKLSLTYMSVDETVKALTHYSNESISYCIMYTALTHFTSKMLFRRFKQRRNKKKSSKGKEISFLVFLMNSET